ncbi:MAG: polysaccharide biosynthesis C-terminal domain-containing protein, partial [Chitinophagaceae bacterium]|nr:polysaccharide biosynthesis C-terminal domain-containing protein [Chitinophagaceae bacterium]
LILVLVGLSIAIMLAIYCCLKLSIIPNSYDEVIYVLPLMLAGQIVICLALLYSNYLTYFERTSVVLWAGLFVSAGSIGLNMLLIPVWKIYGAAITILFSNTCYLAIYYLIIRFYQKRHLVTITKTES